MAPLPVTQPMAQMTAPMAQLPGTQPMAAVSQPITTSTGSFVIVPGPPTTAINSTPTPLYLAVAANQAQMVQMFVERNANPDSMAQAISADGKSMEVKAPLHVAASNGAEYLDTLQELLKSKDLSLNIVNSEGHTALHCAVLNHGRPTRGNNTTVNSLPIIEVLIKAGIEANSQAKKSGKTPLMYAIERRDYNLVESMLRLFDHSKLRSIIQSQTFDGSSCLKIAEGLKGEYKSEDWHKLWNLLNSAYQGQIMNNVLYNRTY
ncbi:hypothetical protein FSP39_003072 [Pinctada imbricata]|uniref:Uncharacterized protein n=1 Tax=Pinctada imbricata TaxID=66713 RepID=A0AA89CD34_PINIB|nr:hypothetical protein FSP39_003072 [Pinctada imbricata]